MGSPATSVGPRPAALLGPLAAAGTALVGCVVLTVADPVDSRLYPTCPFYAVTGRWCPGCGSLRGLRAMLHGDLVAAAGFNLLLVVAVPYLLYSFGAWTATAAGRRGPRPLRLSSPAILGLAAVVVGFGVLRNLGIPPLTWLAP